VAGAYLRARRRLRQRASQPALLFRGNRARPSGGDGSLPPGTRRHRADLSAYNSTESAADFVDLRKALGIAAWNVYGTSYGSYLAQTLVRDHPEGIRSVVLDSVLPTTYTDSGRGR